MKTYGFIGCGNMGGILAACAAKNAGARVLLCDRHNEKIEPIVQEYGAKAATMEEVSLCDYLFLGVKPQALSALAAELRPMLKNGTVLVSMAAGVEIAAVSAMLPDHPIIRIMPNTPAAVGEGTILYCHREDVTKEQLSGFLAALQGAGRLSPLDEKQIDAASALSGCGPAFVYMFIEALADGAVKCGLPRDKALAYAAGTVLGAGKMALESGIHPEALKDAVCSPGGSTIAGVAALEENAFRGAVIAAVEASYQRTKELG